MNLATFFAMLIVWLGLLFMSIQLRKVTAERDHAISELNAIRTEREWKKLEL